MNTKFFFNNHSDTYIRNANWASNPEVTNHSISMLGDCGSKVVIDIGAGDCSLLNLITSNRKIALDISKEMLERRHDKSIDAVVGDIHNSELETSIADVAICRQVIHYCEMIYLFQEIKRILKSNGVLHIAQFIAHPGVPDYLFEFWYSMRGIKNRKHIRNEIIIDEAKTHGFSLLAHRKIEIHVEHTWESFFEKNLVQKDKQDRVKAFFDNAQRENDLTQMNFILSEYGMSYDRLFAFYNFSTQTIKSS